MSYNAEGGYGGVYEPTFPSRGGAARRVILQCDHPLTIYEASQKRHWYWGTPVYNCRRCGTLQPVKRPTPEEINRLLPAKDDA